LWHGSTDTTVAFHNFGEAIKQWTNVLGVSATPTSTENNALQTGWIRTRYADSAGVVEVEAIQETGKGHGDLSVDPEAGEAIHFLGLDGSNPVPDGGTVTLKDSSVADTASPDAFIKMDLAGSTGGTAGTGGVTATGGGGATGGATTSGGTGATGGVTTSGGTRATGGATASGGASATGGTTATGGVIASGGASAVGGTAATGGVIASGGVSATGGVTLTGGTNSTGGVIASGGSLGMGGNSAEGGSANTGGSAAGGSPTTSQGTADTGSKPSKGSVSACSLASGNSNRLVPARLLLVLALLIVGRRRRYSK
jgi:hypothetical protein